jgi:very-short-patch-repair endonuclease
MQNFDPIEFVKSAIAELRRELLDFTARNKLLSFKHPERGGDFIRVVDELPAEMFRRLSKGGMRFKPLPHPLDFALDEVVESFRNALSEIRATDDEYSKKASEFRSDGVDPLQDIKLERSLRDKVRVALGLEPLLRQGKPDPHAFALANAIDPDYQLPFPDGSIRENHQDRFIQTLFFPDDLDRRVRKIYEAYEDHLQEKGINVLHAAFGFLEWYEDESSSVPHHAPLLLAPLTIKRGTAPGQTTYTLSAESDETQVNVTLAEFLKQKHQLTLPSFTPSSTQDQTQDSLQDEASYLEPWLAQVAEVIAPKRRWRVLRFVTIGTFPFSRIALYNDLATENWRDGVLTKHELVARLLGGRGTDDGAEASGMDRDYPLDDPTFPGNVPSVILEADSSQHSALVDALEGKSFVIQGPPGTGKSQTIANIIAAALDANKRVLFMAEKSAALNVVSSRLKDRGLGSFLFELHSDKTRKSEVIGSLDERVKLGRLQSPAHLDRKLEQRRAVREVLSRYALLMGCPVGQLGRPLQELMWFATRYGLDLDVRLPVELRKARVSQAETVDQNVLERSRVALDTLARARDALIRTGYPANRHPWRGVGETNRFLCEAIVEAAYDVDAHLQSVTQEITASRERGLHLPDTIESLAQWIHATRAIPEIPGDARLASLALQAPDQLENFADYIERHLELGNYLRTILRDLENTDARALEDLLDACRSIKVAPSISSLSHASQRARAVVAELEETERELRDFTRTLGISWPISINDALVLLSVAKSLISADNRVLDERTDGMNLSDSEKVIESARKSASALVDREHVLSQHFDLVRIRSEFSAQALYNAADVLAAANALSFLSADSRKANRTWRAVSIGGPKLDARTRASRLRDMARHFVEVTEFAADKKIRDVLGPDFGGHTAPFDLYAEAVGIARRTANELEQLSAPIKESVSERLLKIRTEGIQRLRARFPHDLLDRVTKHLQNFQDADMIDTVLEAARSRHIAIETALELAKHTLTNDATLPTSNAAGTNDTINALLEWQRHETSLQNRSDLTQVFGPTASSLSKDPSPLRAALAVVGAVEKANLPDTMLSELKLHGNPAQYRATANNVALKVAALLNDLRGAWQTLVATAQLSGDKFLGDPASEEAVSLRNIAQRVREAIQNADRLADWMRYHQAFRVASLNASSGVAKIYDDSAQEEPRLADIFELCLVRTLIWQQLGSEGRELGELTGPTLEDVRAQFRRLDKEILDLEAQRIAAKTSLRSAPPGNDQGPRSSWTEMALLLNEVKKRRRHLPIRDMIRRAPNALLALKPVWMMSPLSVAQYLPRIDGFFDLVVIDEASQMRPSDAIGGLARASQAIVVGDPMQLPPTNFFSSGDGGAASDGVGAAADQSSILDLAEARLRRKRMLRWHYRSRHESLIAFSNKHFYEGRLIVFPSAASGDLGIEYEYVGGRYYGGGGNPEEAKAIVRHAQRIMELYPNLSIGIVTTNVEQRELVLEELEQVASSNRSVAEYRERWQETLEPLIVKNLENVQGDERDVVLISTVFGPGETGQVAQRFGPINSPAGHRRLNVLFTRAKRKIVLVTSLHPGDVVPGPNSHPGVHVLRNFLEFASTGRIAPGIDTQSAPDSDFEVHVAERLRLAGYEAVPQVGVDGFRIDIGVRDPSWPYGFLAGVECDGATYHSGVTVRDRDRLRQEILEGLGWRLYRIWSTDWFSNPDREIRKLLSWLDEQKVNAVAA